MRRNVHRAAAAALAVLLGCSMTGCNGVWDALIGKEPAESAAETSEESQTEDETTAETTAATEAETEPPTTEHVSPTETVVSLLGAQIDTDATLDRDSADDAGKNFKTDLSDFIEEGDTVNSFTFVFYAADGTSNIGTFKGGCGISVNSDCAAATDEGWYQSDDFSVQSEGSYCEVTWNVPAEVAPYVAADGAVQVGYWWGAVQKVTLKNVICSYTRTRSLPVDSTETVSVGQTLHFGNDDTNTVKVSLADVLPEDGVPQAVTFDIQGGGSFGKFTGAFGITTDDWYQTDTVAVLTDASDLTLTWIIPDGIKASIPQEAEVMLGYWWGEVNDITLQSVTVKYSIGGAPAAAPVQTQKQEDTTEDLPVIESKGDAAAIAAAIRIGWNLGNSLDSYNKDNKKRDYETSWGNVKTTQAVIDTVRDKGFNAVRIPVSWTNHTDDAGNIDAEWMERVKAVVDYAVKDDLYIILNVHHDDYTWLNPTYADEAAVTAKYVKIWEQIADTFKDYDEHLLFEGLNEPRVIGSAKEWTGGTEEERDVINHLLAKFVSTVRHSGGKNADRTLVVTTHAASITDEAINGLVLPDDKNLIVSIHNYAPWKFATDEYPDARDFDSAGQQELEQQFGKLYNKFVSQGIPVIIGEFGAEDKENTAARTAYYSYYINCAAQRDIPCFIWDNGGEDSFGLLDRGNNTWYYPEIVDAAVSAAASR